MKTHKILINDNKTHSHLCGGNSMTRDDECCSDDWSKIDCKNCLIRHKKILRQNALKTNEPKLNID